jgi:hypothetical protein
MPTFLLVYRSAKNYTPGDPDVMASWQAFFEGRGGNLVDTGDPIFARSTLGDCEPDATALGARSPGADPGLVSFRPPIGKNDQPWPGPSPTASISDDPGFGQDRGCGHCLAASPDHGITHLVRSLPVVRVTDEAKSRIRGV